MLDHIAATVTQLTFQWLCMIDYYAFFSFQASDTMYLLEANKPLCLMKKNLWVLFLSRKWGQSCQGGMILTRCSTTGLWNTKVCTFNQHLWYVDTHNNTHNTVHTMFYTFLSTSLCKIAHILLHYIGIAIVKFRSVTENQCQLHAGGVCLLFVRIRKTGYEKIA